ncbi:MAG TPA: hypothetical protein DEB52_16945 [Hyphomonas sp.]|jgi:hypothetical protein|nr:hypothetical protein [Hyphomonas sp.]HBT37623.1 hypothetical protein [Hyphomonas sp.]|tara:strand:+ start:19719 stop:19970 length:252 start_codon:yes stop_codon:yes gene_type:complete
MRRVLDAATGEITIDEAFTLPKRAPAEVIAAEREAAIRETMQDMEAERLATLRAQAETEFAGAKTVEEIQVLRDLRRARGRAR